MASVINATREFVDMNVDNVHLRIASLRREGERAAILMLHGFGSTKEDYVDLALYPHFANRTIIAYDAPGFGESECDNLCALSIPFLCKVAKALVDFYGLERYHLVGHSMGGLTALILAQSNHNALLSFTNIEGNLVPEDCFLSRPVVACPSNDPHEILDSCIQRLWRAPAYSNPLYAIGLPHKVRPEAVVPIFRSIVDLSDNSGPLETFIQLPSPRMFVYGDQNSSLSYLGKLGRYGVELAEIPYSGHFPMYSNPPALWTRMSEFINQSDVTEND